VLVVLFCGSNSGVDDLATSSRRKQFCNNPPAALVAVFCSGNAAPPVALVVVFCGGIAAPPAALTTLPRPCRIVVILWRTLPHRRYFMPAFCQRKKSTGGSVLWCQDHFLNAEACRLPSAAEKWQSSRHRPKAVAVSFWKLVAVSVQKVVASGGWWRWWLVSFLHPKGCGLPYTTATRLFIFFIFAARQQLPVLK